MADPILSQLQTAAKGLLYPSEQDQPIKAFLWPKADTGDASPTDAAKQHAKADANAPVETQSLADFFAPLTTTQDWYGDAEKASVAQAQQLEAAVKQHLSDIQVIRIGDSDKKVYLVGKTSQGDLAGLTTQVTET